MKGRIEIWVDSEFTTPEHLENIRWLLEKQTWDFVRTHGLSSDTMVQANEVPIPLPSHGTREDYVEYKESQARCTST